MEFNEIRSRNDLAAILKTKPKTLAYLLYKSSPNSFYHSFELPKKNGSTRKINASSGILKIIQKRLAACLWEHQQRCRHLRNISPNISHAFEKNKSIITNAKIHKNKRIIINFDIKDFFDSIHFGRVAGFFHKNRDYSLPKGIAIILAQLTCYNGTLPQGAPSSPIITNLLCQILDIHLLKIAKEYRLDYTRYADDLTFSTNAKEFLNHIPTFSGEIEHEISSFGFRLNQSKTRVVYKSSQQTVTGLVVNKKINVSRDFYKKTRAMTTSLYRTGEFYIDNTPGAIKQLEGRLSFIYQIEQCNNRAHDSNQSLSAKEKLYRNFLFYKYFVANKQMLIITEGKTDILYIKAALKKLYKEYPSLITKEPNKETFNFRISFFNRTPNMLKFFGISLDGADTMTTLYKNYITTSKKNNSLIKFFQKQGSIFSASPIIFLFDNELLTAKRPLKKFVNYSLKDPKRMDELKNNFHTLLNPVCNIHLLATPLPGNKTECEIEDLFSEETLNTKINGRTFNRNDPDPSKFYNKDIFSKYIMRNYTNIDFSGFRPLLNILSFLQR